MDDASEDSRPAQPGFVKKIYLTISQVKALNRMLICFEGFAKGSIVDQQFIGNSSAMYNVQFFSE